MSVSGPSSSAPVPAVAADADSYEYVEVELSDDGVGDQDDITYEAVPTEFSSDSEEEDDDFASLLMSMKSAPQDAADHAATAHTDQQGGRALHVVLCGRRGVSEQAVQVTARRSSRSQAPQWAMRLRRRQMCVPGHTTTIRQPQ